MKSKVFLLLISCLCICAMVSNTFAQKPGKWSSPKNHLCYQGIKISVMNMGYGKEGGGYMWGVRFTNFYKLSVSFKYKLSIGEKIVAASDGETCSNLGNGISKIDGRDKATAKIFQSPSDEWNLYIWDVCFSGMKCGGANNCYAECDKQSGKENQLCGLMDDYKPTPGSNLPSVLTGKEDAPPAEVKTEEKGPSSIWVRDDKVMKMILQKSTSGLYASREGYTGTTFFKKIGDNTYRLEAGKEFNIIKFDGEKQFGYWNTGVLENIFTLEEEEEPDNLTAIPVQAGIWVNVKDTIGIKIVEGGLLYDARTSAETKKQFYKQVRPNTYKCFDADSIHYCLLTIKGADRIIKTCNGYILGDYKFITAMMEQKDQQGNITEYSIPAYSEWQPEDNIGFKLFIGVNYDEIVYMTKGTPFTVVYNKSDHIGFTRKDNDTLSRALKLQKPSRISYEVYTYRSTKNRIDTSVRYFQLIAATINESVPADTLQAKPTIDISGNWEYLGNNKYKKLQISFGSDGLQALFEPRNNYIPFKKTAPNVYEYQDQKNNIISIIKYLTNGTLSISNNRGNLHTVSYYTRPVPTK